MMINLVCDIKVMRTMRRILQTPCDVKIYIRHTKTNNIYTVVEAVKVKIDGKWHDAVAYKNEDETFVRTLDDFSGFTIAD